LGLPAYGGKSGPYGLDPGMRKVYSEVKEAERPGFLERFGKSVGGLGYAAQNVATAIGTMDPKYLGAAGKNLVEMAGSVFTLDPITGIYTKVTGGGITEPWERPTFTETMENVGLEGFVPENKFARFGVDLAGGIFSDPLVYAKFAGKALPFLSDMFKTTGKLPRDELLAAFMATNRGAAEIGRRAPTIYKEMTEEIGKRVRSGKINVDDLNISKAELFGRVHKASKERAAQELLESNFGIGEKIGDIAKNQKWADDATGVVSSETIGKRIEDGLDQLRKSGYLEHAGIGIDMPWPISPLARRIDKRLTRTKIKDDYGKTIGYEPGRGHHARYPFIKTKEHPIFGGTGFLDPTSRGVIGMSLPGMAYRGVRKVSPGTTEFIEKSMKWVGNNIFKKGLYGIKGRAEHKLANDAADGMKQELYAANTHLARSLSKNVGGVSDEVGESIVYATHTRSDELLQSVNEVLRRESEFTPRKMPYGEERGVRVTGPATVFHHGRRYYNVVYQKLAKDKLTADVLLDEKIVFVDRSVIRQMFADKVWTKRGPYYGLEIGEDAFRTVNDLEEFIIGAEIRKAEALRFKMYDEGRAGGVKPDILKGDELLYKEWRSLYPNSEVSFSDWLWKRHAEDVLPQTGARKVRSGRLRLDRATEEQQISGFTKDLQKQILSLKKEISSAKGKEGKAFKQRWMQIVGDVAKRHNVHPKWETAEEALGQVIYGNKGEKTIVQARIAETIMNYLMPQLTDMEDISRGIGKALKPMMAEMKNAPSGSVEKIVYELVRVHGWKKFIDGLSEAHKLNKVDEFLDDFITRGGVEAAINPAARAAQPVVKGWSARWNNTVIDDPGVRRSAAAPGGIESVFRTKAGRSKWRSQAKKDLRKYYPAKGTGSTANRAKVSFLHQMIDSVADGHLTHEEFLGMFHIADLFHPRIFKNVPGRKAADRASWLQFIARKGDVDISEVPSHLRHAFEKLRTMHDEGWRGVYHQPGAEESLHRVIGIFTDRQNVDTFAHELGHSGYFTMLTKADHNVVKRAHRNALGKTTNQEDIREFFAEEFSRWLIGGVSKSEGLVAAFTRVWEKAKELMKAFSRTGAYKPSQSVRRIFHKIAPHVEDEVGAAAAGLAWKAKKVRAGAAGLIDNLKLRIQGVLVEGSPIPLKELRVYSDSIDNLIHDGVMNHQRRVMFDDVVRRHSDLAQGNPEFGKKVGEVLDYVYTFNKNILKQTQALGALPLDVARLELLLYMPRQVSDELANILSSVQIQKPEIIKAIMQQIGSIKSKYEKYRNTPTVAEYRKSLLEIAAKHGITPTEDVVKHDLVDLLLSRGEAFNRLKYDSKFLRRMATLFGSPKMGRRILPYVADAESAKFAEESAKAFGTKRLESVVDDYLSRVQKDQRRGVGTVFKADDVDWGHRPVSHAVEEGVFVNKPIGFNFPEDTVNLEAFVRDYAIGLAPRRGAARGLAKLNEFIRMSLTFGVLGLPFPSFTSRNIVGGMLQAMTDPEMRAADALRPAMAVLHDFPLTRWIAGKIPMTRKAKGVSLMRRSLGKGDDAKVALKELEEMGLAVGDIPLESIAKEAGTKGVVGTDFATVERLKKEVAEPEAFIPMIMSMMGRGADLSPRNLARIPRWFVANARTNMLPIQLASAAEDTLRLNSYMSLRGAGVGVDAAVQRVNAAHINYHYVSEADRILRDWMPFVRFRIGTSPRLISVALNNPKGILPFSHMLNILQKTHSGSGVIAPDYLMKSFAIPLDVGEDGRVRFISSFGIIHEELENLMEPVLTDIADPMKLRRWSQQQIGARLHPVIRTFFEFIGDRNFFRDKPFFAHREAPDWMLRAPFRQAALKAGLLTGRVKRDGTTAYQVDKWYHPLSTSVGLNRLSGEFDKIFDKEKDWWQRVINSATGIKIKDVDEQMEMMRVLKKAITAAHMNGQVKEMSRFYSTGDAPEGIKELLRAHYSLKKRVFSRGKRKQIENSRFGRSSGLGLPGPIPSKSLSEVYPGR
tara:strand:- start:4335 stop:10292 length:5958 start_codon:yes stop_codon:yes gene_type:complete